MSEILPKNFLRDSLDSYLEGLNKKVEAREEGVIHPSELHSCARKAWYCLTHTEKRPYIEPKLRLIFDTGHYLHDQLGNYYTAIFGDAAILEIETVAEDLELVGHADIMIWGEDRPDDVQVFIPGLPSFGVELKTTKTEIFTRPPLAGSANAHPLTAHIWQAHCYMYCTGVRLWKLLYYNKNDSRLKEFTVPFDDELWQEIEAKIKRILDARDAGTPPEGETGYQCSNCPYRWICDAPPATKDRKSWRKQGQLSYKTRSRS